MSRETQGLQHWLEQASLDPALREELLGIKGDDDAVTDRFYRELTFGTSGLRGIMGAGANRMNVHVIDRATQGVALYMKETFEEPRAVLAYDTRNHSKEFACRAAEVLAGNGVGVRLFAMPSPVPSLSYAIRHLGLDMGIMLTASHNPKEYNGYKVYGPDGCQIAFDVPDKIYEKIGEQDYFTGIKRMPLFDPATLEVLPDVPAETFAYVPDEVAESFVEKAVRYSLPGGGEEDLRIVYSPLHGVGAPFVLPALELAGFVQIHPVREQMVQDGNFPTCSFPNPERPEALTMGIAECRDWQGDLFIATDPDADRIGITVPDGGDCFRPTGNQIGILLTNYLCENQENVAGKYLIRSIVSTPYVDTIAAAHGVKVATTLTGFKYIGAVMEELTGGAESPDEVLLGFEEANGYLAAPHVRDKDGVSAAVLVAQMAAFYKARGLSLKDALEDIYETYGYTLGESFGFVFPGAEGVGEMAQKMDALRKDPAVCFPAGQYEMKDYAPGIEGLPPANVLEFNGKSGAKAIIRPSGTEPKIKAYLFVQDDDRSMAAARMEALKEQVFAFMGIEPEKV